MKRFLRNFAAASLALLAGVATAWAETDENDLTPKHWYKFDGNLDSSGETALTISGENGASYVESVKDGQAYQFKQGYHPYGSGIKRGSGDFTVVAVAKTADRDHGIIWTQGAKTSGRGFGLVSVGATQVALRVFGENWSSSGEDLAVATVSDATESYHVYTVIYTESTKTFALYVDDATEAAGSGQVADSATESGFPNNNFQWGSLFSGVNYSMTQGYDACLDDFRLYQQALTTDQIKNIVATFRDVSFVWGTAGKSGQGVATKNDGAFGLAEWTFNFSQDDNIVHDAIDTTKKVVITKIRLMQRETKASQPTAATLKQGTISSVATSVTSVDDESGMTLYDSEGAVAKTWAYHEFLFDGLTEFDPTANITLSFGATVGCWVMQPPNSVMVQQGYSPVIEITGSYPSGAADYVATVSGDTAFSGITAWEPSRPDTFDAGNVLEIDNTAAAKLTMDEDLAVRKIKVVNAEGNALTLAFDATKSVTALWDFSLAAGGVVFDASGLDGTELAKNAVAGAPYSHWLLEGTVSGGENVTVALPTMPSGYDAEKVVDGYGVRVVVTAPKSAKFGSVDINFMGNTSQGTSDANAMVSGLTSDVGAHPVVGTSWTDLESKNYSATVTKYVNTSGTLVTGASIPVTISQCANSYGSGAAANTLFYGYIDDSKSPIVEIGNIPFSKYRVIVYRATDQANVTFSAVQVGTSSSDMKICYGPEKSGTDVGNTVYGSAEVDWGNSNQKASPVEGVNYVVSDVLTGTAGSATAYVYSHKHAGRATVAAIQIVEVGKIIEGYKEYKATVSAAGTYNLTGLTWTPSPFNPTASDNVKVTIDPDVSGEVVINLDKSGMALQDFVVVSKGEATVKLTGSNPAAISTWDFSSAKGRVAFGFVADYSRVTLGTYPRIGIAYPYTGTIQSGYDYIGTGNVLTMTTINSGTVLIGGSGTLHGDLYVGLVNDIAIHVMVGGTYISPDNDVSFSCAHGTLTISEGADISISSVALNRNAGDAAYGGGWGRFDINGKLTVTSECDSNVSAQVANHKGIILQYDWLSPRGLHTTVSKTGSLIAEKSWIQLAGNGYNYVTLTVDGGVVKARGANVGPASVHGTAYNPSVAVKNGGTLQLSEGVLNQDNGRFSVNDGTLSAYSYNSSAGYTWSPTNTTVTGTMTIDANGLSVVNAGDISGASAKVAVKSSTAGGTVTMNAASTYGGGTEIASGAMLKLGNIAAVGTGAVSVGSGATLDYAGFSATNALAVAGALANSGSAVQFLAHIDFTGDASIGGSGGFSFIQSSLIDLGGHTLTLNGTGTVKLGGFTITGGGAVVVASGTLASNGATALEDIDLSIGSGGKLDFSSGNSISCRDFTSSGTITGTQAALIVSGTFDAQKTVTVPKLTLKDNATLNGVNLKVTTLLKMENYLHIIVPTVKDQIQVATVPSSSSSVTLCKYPYVNGLTTYTMTKVGTGLYVNKGTGVIASISLDTAVGWTNFQELKIEGGVGLHGQAFGHTNINAVITSTDGTVTTQRFDYAVQDGKFSYIVTGVDAGKVYDVSVFLSIEGAEVQSASSETVNTVTARTLDWIDEDVYTFAGTAAGTGDWNRNGVASEDVSAGVIRFAAEDWSARASFSPTNDSLAIRSSRMKDIRFKASFARAGFLEEDAEWPKIPAGREAAVTMVAKAEGDTDFGFAVATNGAWCIIDPNAFPAEKGKEYEFLVHFDYDAATVTYSIETGKLVRIASSTFVVPGTSDKSLLEFAGAGTVKTIVGQCHDAHLMLVGDTEYATLDDARAVAGETRDIVPLWWSRYSPSDASGRFNIVDTAGYLDVAFAKWYHYAVDADGKVRRVYRYIAGNNWIEYADETGVEPVNGGWRVTNEVGLAWIAESATNGWFGGNVTLGADLDLSSKNWTPVSRFTGSFDGQGYTIKGLNNTNVVESDLLGEAGHYFAAPTNDWGYSAYGLFGCATNAAFSNLKLTAVAISNTADSVAALLGVHAGGDLTVENVVNDSGYVFGEGRAVAGLLTVGGNGGQVGDVTVTANANHATIVGALADDADGGNVAQILAGTTWGTTFGNVVATDNEGDGTFDVSVTYGADTANWDESRLNWLALPVCNFAPAVVCTDEDGVFWRFVEANESKSVPVDPFKRTARMLAGLFNNNAKNIMGEWMDTISTLPEGGSFTLENKGDDTLDGWETVNVDRDLTIDLNGKCVYGVYDCDVFSIDPGKTLTLKNGAVYYAHGYLPTNGVAVLDNVKTAEIVGDDLYARTVPLSGLEVKGEYVTIDVPYSSVDFNYIVDSTPTLAQDWEIGVAEAEGTGGKISIQVPAAGESGFYRVRIERIY